MTAHPTHSMPLEHWQLRRNLQLFSILSIVALLGFIPILSAGPGSAYVGFFALLIPGYVIVIALARAGSMRAGSWLLCFLLSLGVLLGLFSIDLLHHAYGFLSLPIVMTGLLLRPREIWTVTLGSCATLMVVTLLSSKPFWAWYGFGMPGQGALILMVLSGGFAHLTMRVLTEAKITQANSEALAANEAVKASEALNMAERALEAREHMIAMLSHDIRTPLTAIIGYAELLEEEAEALGLEQFCEDLDAIMASSMHLVSLLGDILDFAKLEDGFTPLHTETIAMQSFFAEVASTMSPLLSEASNQMVLEMPDPLGELVGDRTKIQRVLFNLIGNASKFTKRGSVTLRVLPETREGTRGVCMNIIDTGVGMTPEAAATIFRPFQQVGDGPSQSGGVGLGLAICERLCEMMDGEINVTSQLDVGTTMSVWLPKILTRGVVREPSISSTSMADAQVRVSRDSLPYI